VKRRLAGGQVIHQAAQAEQVAPLVYFVTLDLLGGHVLGGPQDGSGERTRRRLIDGPGQPEVNDLHLAVLRLEPDVVRFDIPVQQTPAVGRGQARGYFSTDPQHYSSR
jgi:hypothetical protein